MQVKCGTCGATEYSYLPRGMRAKLCQKCYLVWVKARPRRILFHIRRGDDMPNKNYVSGRNFEMRVKRLLEKRGWFVVRRGASRLPDLVALRRDASSPTTVALAVSCKYASGRFDEEEMRRLSLIREQYGIIPILASCHEQRGSVVFTGIDGKPADLILGEEKETE